MVNKMIERKTWFEFQQTGLLWFVNTILHTFGWSIVIDINEDSKEENVQVYPARVTFRGFSSSSNGRGYQRISKYLKENADALYNEAQE